MGREERTLGIQKRKGVNTLKMTRHSKWFREHTGLN